LVGIAAIVASLIFVGPKLKQSQDIVVAQQYQDRAATALDFYAARTHSDQATCMRDSCSRRLAILDRHLKTNVCEYWRKSRRV